MQENMDKEERQTIERETRLYPQGGADRVLLRDKFQENAPFYLRTNKPVIVRKTNAYNYASTLE